MDIGSTLGSVASGITGRGRGARKGGLKFAILGTTNCFGFSELAEGDASFDWSVTDFGLLTASSAVVEEFVLSH